MSLDHVPPITAPKPVVLRSVRGQDRVLTAEALGFIAELQTRFGNKLHALMVARERRQEHVDAGRMPEYLAETVGIRKGIWAIPALPEALLDRRIEITGPAERKAMIEALGVGAMVYVADLEDATAPSFNNIIAAHEALIDLRDGTLAHEDRISGETLQLADTSTLLMLRPRALHVEEANVLIGGHPISAALFDIGLHFHHSGRALAAKGQGPFLELPKIESHREAKFWAELIGFAEERVGLPAGTTKATIAIESLFAAFEMDEIVWELRAYAAGLTAGRANLAASYIRTLRAHSEHVLPEQARLAPDEGFLAACHARTVKVAHRRGLHSIARSNGGTEELRRQLDAGHDGICFDTPDEIAAGRPLIEAAIPGPHRVSHPRQYARIEPEMLMRPHKGPVSEAGLHDAIRLSIGCLAGWLSGRAPSRIDGLRHGIASAELGRLQLWQWRRHGARIEMSDGNERRLTSDWLSELIHLEMVALIEWLGPDTFHRGRYASAARIVQEAVLADTPPDYVTRPGYALLNALD